MPKIRNTFPLGCFGNKYREVTNILNFIEPLVTNDTVFIEPFCGSCCISFNLYIKHPNIIYIINDLDEHRINFYKNMKSEEERTKLYELEKEIQLQGREFYNSIVEKGRSIKLNPYLSYVIGKRIHAYREGLFPDKPFKTKEVSDDWINFFNKCEIFNKDYFKILEDYKDNENAIIYLDPPYLNSCNTQYSKYNENSQVINEDLIIIKDNTKIYIDILNLLKSSKSKIFMSLNRNSITEYLFKDFILNSYNKIYDTSVGGKCNNKKRVENILYISNTNIINNENNAN
jgi:site-specific DNA-adenine methylase